MPPLEWWDTCSAPPPPDAADLSWTSRPPLPAHPAPDGLAVRVSLRGVHSISPWIYGENFRRTGDRWDVPHLDTDRGVTLGRLGGNRITGFNWENGASHSGRDLSPAANDGWLGRWRHPGGVLAEHLARAHCSGAAAWITVPLSSRVAADRDGPLGPGEQRFLPLVDQAPDGPRLPPDPHDGLVERTAMVAWLQERLVADAPPLLLSLGNEPSLWPVTHPAMLQGKTTYASMIETTRTASAAIKALAPELPMYGGGFYGFNGWRSLQDAPDAHGRDFLDTWLAGLADPPLLDGVDLHWYSEHRGGGVRITGPRTEPVVVDARLQAPRSLWDPTFFEDSWLVSALGGPVQLIPRLTSTLRPHLPQARLAITEYSYGAEHHISGGLAVADALGAFGRHDLFAAAFFATSHDPSFALGAIELMRAAPHRMGDVSLQAISSDPESLSAWAAASSAEHVTILLVHKRRHPETLTLTLEHPTQLVSAQTWTLTERSSHPQRGVDVSVSQTNHLELQLEPLSATMVVLRSSGED